VKPLTDDVDLTEVVRSAGRWIGIGVGVGLATSVGLLTVSSPRGATDTAFALGVLVLGFGVTAWSGAIGLGLATSVGLLTVSSPRGATDTAFALGVLVLGFGVTAWSGAIGLGNSIERMQEYRDGESRWTQAGARRAFAVLTWVGLGWAIGSVAASVAAVGI